MPSIAIGTVILFVIVVVIAAAAGDAHFDKLVQREVASILPNTTPATFTADLLTDLPAPVQKYFQYAVPIGHPLLESAQIKQTGFYRGAPDRDWMGFTSTEYMTAHDRAFIWHVRMQPAPIFWIEGRDHYLNGEGSMLIKAFSLMPIVNAQPEPGINQSALSRYLLEAMWIPTALLPRDDLRWEAMDANHARMVVTDETGFETWVEYTFNDVGEIVEGKGNRFLNGEEGIWKAIASDYSTFDGVRVPTENTAYWLTDDGEWDYVRMHTENVIFNFHTAQ